MSISLGLDLINGINVGIEYLPACEDYDHTVIVDLLVVRLLFQWFVDVD
jgi:hypothetical protein